MNASRSQWRTRGLWLRLLLLTFVVGFALAGCSSKQPAVNVVLPPAPEWFAMADKAVQAEYTWAASHHDQLKYIPCYCGCESIGHTDNSTCYFTRNTAGEITGYDQHAVG